MGDPLQQQTRVLLLNGQTIILQGDVGDNSISEINAEILGQALQEAANSTDGNPSHGTNTSGIADNHNISEIQLSANSSTLGPGNHQNEANLNEDDANNIVAIFESENGETQTIQLTLEQAAALGFQVTSDPGDLSEKKHADTLNLVPQNENKVIDKSFDDVVTASETHLSTTLPIVSSQVSTLPIRSVQPQCSNILGSLLKPSSSLLYTQYPQYVGNNMTYSVKLPDNIALDAPIQVPVSDILPAAATTQTLVPASMLSPQIITNVQPKVTSLVNQQKISIPNLNKNVTRTSQSGGSVVRIKPSTNPVSAAIIRPATSKTIIPKIQGTPTSMANLAMSSAQPISSTASMVRVLSTSTSTTVKPVLSTTVSTTPVKTIDTSSVPRVAANVAKPLGSSENPIQLVQHGQTFHSMQPLSQEQLKQIATVLQQKQLDTSRNSKNVLYDASTNTRIIYRVVYPEDLALKKPTGGSGSGSSSGKVVGRVGATGGRKGRPPKNSKILGSKKTNSDEDEEHIGDNDLSKGEREERKKVLPRTRSGRLSRPPRHMVKDYKRIHHLDFAEPDLDDSDGGYSDYRISDSEQGPDALGEEMPIEGQPVDAVLASSSGAEGNSDVVTVKRAIHSKFRCPTCQKMYLGYRRLARHFEVYPDHGSMDDVPRGPPPAPTPAPNSGHGGDIHEAVFESLNGGSPHRVGMASSRGKGKKRGLHFLLSPSEKAERRKAKLRELLSGYDPSEISQVAGPIVAQSLDLWQMLLLKIASSEDHPSRFAALIAEMKTLLTSARSKVAKILSSPIPNEDSSITHRVEINDIMVASALNVACGTYDVLVSEDRKLQWHPPSLQLINSSSLDPDSLPHPQPYSLLCEPEAKRQKLWIERRHENDDLDESQTDKSFLDTTNESEKPSDTSIGSDTPLDDIVKAELKNLATKSGLEDFVAPPVSVSSSNLSMSQVVDFVTSSFSSPATDTVSASHFSEHLVMNMPSIVTSTPPETSSSLKLTSDNMHFGLASPSSGNHLGLTDNTNHMQNTPSSSQLPSENMHFELTASSCRMEINDDRNELQTPSKLSTQNLNFDLSSPTTDTHLALAGTSDQLETPSKLNADNLHFELTSSTNNSRLELSGGSIDVNLDSHLVAATHELDFEALSEEFNRNTSS